MSDTAAIPSQAKPVLDDYAGRLQDRLPDLVTGLYLHGSVALGAFDPRLSDIDFLALLSRPCTKSDLACLAEIHRRVRSEHPHPALDGGYLQWADVGKNEDAIQPYPYYHNGRLEPDKRVGVNAVTWWTIGNCGLALIGPEPQNLDIEVDGAALTAYLLPNLNTYWRAFTKNPRRVLWLLSDSGLQWVILGVLRQYYTFREQAIISKTEAGHYGLGHLPERWGRLIREALRIRQGAGVPLYRSRIGRAADAHRFLRFMIDYCNATFGPTDDVAPHLPVS